MFDLGDLQAVALLDRSNMLDRIRKLPDQLQEAWQQVSALNLPDDCRQVSRIVVAGMGGSAIGGDLLASYLHDSLPTPIVVVRGYKLPAWVDENTLLIASSFSGDTEETLACYTEARRRGAPVVAVTTGGQLAALAEGAGLPVVRIHADGQPRAAVGYSFTSLLGIAVALGLAENQDDSIAEAMAVMRSLQAEIGVETPLGENSAKQLAVWLMPRVALVLGSDYLAPVARRWKTQLNENSDHWAIFEELPEANHNTVVGTRWPAGQAINVGAVFLHAPDLHPRNKVRIAVTQDLLERRQVASQVVASRGAGRLARMFSLIHQGDFVSYYLALLNEVDPTAITPIQYLKQRLAALAQQPG